MVLETEHSNTIDQVWYYTEEKNIELTHIKKNNCPQSGLYFTQKVRLVLDETMNFCVKKKKKKNCVGIVVFDFGKQCLINVYNSFYSGNKIYQFFITVDTNEFYNSFECHTN